MSTEMVANIEQWPIGRLIGHKNNARTHSKLQVAQIAASIVEFGFVNPVLVCEDNVIIAGHGRLEAAKSLELKEVPVIVLSHLSETQRRALMIADNKLSDNAGWDEVMLNEELSKLQELDFNIDVLGFSDNELDRLLGQFDELDEPAQRLDQLTHTQTKTFVCPKCGYETQTE